MDPLLRWSIAIEPVRRSPSEKERSEVAVDSTLLREVMGRFATGVTVVTTRVGDETSAMTANAVLSLSLDPPLILVSVQRDSHMHRLLMCSDCFAVSILQQDQEHLSQRFAEPGPKDLSDLEVRAATSGAPIIVPALAFADCRIRQVVAGGDHDLFIGEMTAGEVNEDSPLLFYAGGYRRLSPGGGK